MASDLVGRLKRRLRPQALAAFGALGYSGRAGREVLREAEWWLRARLRAGRTRVGLIRGQTIAWTSSDYAELVPVDVPAAGPGEVTVLVDISAVSPGTERAQFLRLPNTPIPSTPGYSAAGTVLRVGAHVEGLVPGDRVAVAGAPHASVVTVAATDIHAVPDGVALADASLVQLGVICGQGVRKAELEPGERFGVIGTGVIGALAQRLAVAGGSVAAAVVATSTRNEDVARAGGAERFLVTGADDAEIAALGLHVVIEAAGTPDAVNVAISAAAPDGRIVLLGSPRGPTSGLALAAVRSKRLTLIGAHVGTLTAEGKRANRDLRAAEARAFMAALESGMRVSDLRGSAVDPRECAIFYRRLASGHDIRAAHFDWNLLPAPERVERGSFARLSDLGGRGMEEAHARGGTRKRASGLLAYNDPFAGSQGRLRLGILGCGDIASLNAGAAVAAPNTELTACFDPVPELARDIADRFGGVPCSTASALLDRADVDAVILSVPHHLHAPLADQAARAGKHVVVEKPLANDLRSAAAILAAGERESVAVSVCFPARYEPSVVIARRLIETGAVGELGGAFAKVLLDKKPAYWVGGFAGRSISDWRRSREKAGGGTLIMNASHYLDLIRHLAGAEVVEVAGFAEATDGVAGLEDVASFSLRFDGRAVATVLACSAVRGADATELRVWGADGHVALEPEPRLYTHRAVDGARPTRWHTFGRLPRVNARAVYLSRLATAIHRGEEPDVGAREGLAVQALIEAAYRAAEERRAVSPADLLREIEA